MRAVTRPHRDPGQRNIAPRPTRPRTNWLLRLHLALVKTRPR